MKIRYFCGIGAELKRQRIDFDYMNQIYLYVLSGEETLSEVTAANFFNEVAISLQPNDIIFIYSGDDSLHTPYKVSKDTDNNVTLTEIVSNALQEVIDELPETIGNLLSDGSIPMDTGYTPTNDLDIATKEYVDSAGGDVTSVNGQTGVVVIDADDIDDSTTINKFTTASDISKLAGIEAGADVTDIAGQTEETIASGDYVLFSDTDDSGSLKKDTVQGIIDLTSLETNGGTGQSTYTQGDILYSDGANSLAKLGAGTAGQVLQTGGAGANPSWVDVSGGGSITVTPEAFQTLGDSAGSDAVFKVAYIEDGKILQAYTSTNDTTTTFNILNVATDGIVTSGTDATLSHTNKYNYGFNNEIIVLSATKAIYYYIDDSDLKATLLTLDTSTNTVTVNNTVTITTSNTQQGGVFGLEVDDTSAVIAYNTATYYTYGRILTVSGSTLSVGSQQIIFYNTTTEIPDCSLTMCKDSNYYYTYCEDANDQQTLFTTFTIDSGTINVLKRNISLFNGYTTTPIIAYSTNDYYPVIHKASSADSSKLTVIKTYKREETSDISDNSMSQYISVPSATERISPKSYYETDSHLLLPGYDHNNLNQIGTFVTIVDKMTNYITRYPMYLDGEETAPYKAYSHLCKIRDGEALVMSIQATSYDIYYNRLLIEGIE